MEFGMIEKNLRLEKELTMKQVADGVGITESAVSRYESGKREPNLTILSRFCKFYGVTADYMLGLVDEPQAKYGQVWNPASIPGPRKVKARAARLKDKPHKLGGAG